MSSSALITASNSVASVKDSDGFILTEPFLGVCRLVLPVIDQLGTAFMLVRTDINGNIQRLADKAAQDPAHLHRLFALVQDDLVRGTQSESTSVTKGLLWLMRAMEFTLDILQRVSTKPDLSLSQAVNESYSETLLKFHGFIASSAFYLAFKFLPTRESFFNNLGLGHPGSDVQKELADFVTAFSPIVAEIHKFLSDNNLDDPAKV